MQPGGGIPTSANRQSLPPTPSLQPTPLQSPPSNLANLDKFSEKKRFRSLSVNNKGKLEEVNFITAWFRSWGKNYQARLQLAAKNYINDTTREAIFNNNRLTNKDITLGNFQSLGKQKYKILRVAMRAKLIPTEGKLPRIDENLLGRMGIIILKTQPNASTSLAIAEGRTEHISSPFAQAAAVLTTGTAVSAAAAPASPAVASATKVAAAVPAAAVTAAGTAASAAAEAGGVAASAAAGAERIYSREEVLASFRGIRSGALESTNLILKGREDFLNEPWQAPAPIIGRSSFVSDEMLEHLMRDKKPRALGVKFRVGDKITNGEGILHTFVTPVCSIRMTGDYHWYGDPDYGGFGLQGEGHKGKLRPVIMSAAIHPDFELDGPHEVVMRLVRVPPKGFKKEASPPPEPKLSDEGRRDVRRRDDYDNGLVRMLQHHLTANGLPPLDAATGMPTVVEAGKPVLANTTEAIGLLETLIKEEGNGPNLQKIMQNQFVKIGEDIISLEVFYNLYVEQLKNEFAVLELAASQGYIYTIAPPSIFAKHVNPKLMNRLQILAFKQLAATDRAKYFSHLKAIGYSDFADSGAVGLLSTALQKSVPVVSKSKLYTQKYSEHDKRNFDDKYAPEQLGPEFGKYALVLHNNSDAFGNNILSEGASSLDGVLGSYSDASVSLKPDREDLVSFVV